MVEKIEKEGRKMKETEAKPAKVKTLIKKYEARHDKEDKENPQEVLRKKRRLESKWKEESLHRPQKLRRVRTTPEKDQKALPRLTEGWGETQLRITKKKEEKEHGLILRKRKFEGGDNRKVE